MDGKRNNEDISGVGHPHAAENNDAPTKVGNNDSNNTANNSGNNNNHLSINEGNDSNNEAESYGSALSRKDISPKPLEGVETDTILENNEALKDAEGNNATYDREDNDFINNEESKDSISYGTGNNSTKNIKDNDQAKYPEINDMESFNTECEQNASKNNVAEADNDDVSRKLKKDEGTNGKGADVGVTSEGNELIRNADSGDPESNLKPSKDNPKSQETSLAKEAKEHCTNQNDEPMDADANKSAVLGAENHNETKVANVENGKKHPHRQLRYRLVKTGCLVTTWICIGLFTELSGPTFKDLELRMDLPTKEATEAVSRATSGRSLGFMAGAVIGGFLVDRFKRKGDLFIAISLCCASAFTVAVPWMSTFATMWFMMFCQGTFEGIINIAGQEIILLLWGEKSAGPMHLLHFGFGMGSFINPIIAQPFLATKVSTNVTDLGNTTSFNTGNVTTVDTLVGSRIEYAYLIAALISASFSSTFFWFQYKGVPHGGYVEDYAKPKQSTKPVKTGCKQYLSLIDPATCADGRRLAGFSIFALLFIYFFQAVGGERIYSKFIRNFALDQLHFSSSEATYLNSSFWISFSVGRFLGFVVAIWVPIRILIMVECFSGLGFAVLLNFLGHNNKLALWVLTQPMALFVAPLFPSGVAWSDHYLKMSGIGITILIAGGSIGGAVYIWVIGYVYPNFGPRSFLYMVAVYSAAASVSVSLMSFAGCLHGDRFQKERMEMEIEPEKDDDKTVTYITSVPLEDL